MEFDDALGIFHLQIINTMEERRADSPGAMVVHFPDAPVADAAVMSSRGSEA